MTLYFFDYSDNSVGTAGAALSNSRRLLHERWYLSIFQDRQWTGMQVSILSLCLMLCKLYLINIAIYLFIYYAADIFHK